MSADARPAKASILVRAGQDRLRRRSRGGAQAQAPTARADRPDRALRVPRLGRRARAPRGARQGARDRRTCAARRRGGRRLAGWRPGGAKLPGRRLGGGARLGPEPLARAAVPGRAGSRRAPLPDRPAVARRVDGHALWVNTAALKAAGSTRRRADPHGGRILRRADGSPSGVLVDNAMELVDARDAGGDAGGPSSAGSWRGAAACARVGLTEVQDASGYGPEAIAVAREARGARRAADPRLRDGLARAGGASGGRFREGRAHRRRLGLPDRARDQGATPTARSAAAARRCSRTTPTSPATAACS